MKSDIDRWNKKYSAHQYSSNISPDSILVANSSHLPQEGTSLDLACGVCDNALYLAELGFCSFAVDASETAIRFGQRKARANHLHILGFVADLDTYPLPEEYFHVIVVVRYLNRKLIEPIKRALKPDGVVLMRTFNTRHLEKKPTFPESYVLHDSELTAWFNGWSCIDTNDEVTSKQTESYWIGKKPNPQ